MRGTTFNWLNSFNKSQMANISRPSSIVGRIGHSYIGSEYITSFSEINYQSSIGVFNLLDNLSYMNYTSIGYIGNAK